MKETDAVSMQGLFPTPTGVELAKISNSFATFTGTAQTVIVYNDAEIFVAVDTTNDLIIDATGGGAISTAVVGGSGPTVQAITSAIFDYAHLGNTSGQFISLVNGADTPLQYDGTTWSASSISGTGLTVTDLHTVVEYAERLWFAGDGFDVWYLPVNAITGTAVRLNLASLFQSGGRLNSIVTISADAQSILADFIAFVSTEGEIVVFAGTDPTDASLWVRYAHMKYGRPVIRGNRAWCKFGADAVLITTSGLLSLRRALGYKSDDPRVYLSDKIRNEFNREAVSRFAGFSPTASKWGWQVFNYPEGQKLYVNMGEDPLNLSPMLYVMNTETGAWSVFNEELRNIALLDGTAYASRSLAGDLGKLDQDADTNGGSCIQAFNSFKNRGNIKYLSTVRPVVTVSDIDTIKVGTVRDYNTSGSSYTATIQSPSDGTTSAWRGVSGIGYAIGPTLQIVPNDTSASATWFATDFLYEVGPPL